MVEYRGYYCVYLSRAEKLRESRGKRYMFYLWEKNRQKLSCYRQKWRTLLLLLLLFVLFFKERERDGTSAIVRDSYTTWCQVGKRN